jgi:pimeloyl-ACP methyl ester carboxylesterase
MLRAALGCLLALALTVDAASAIDPPQEEANTRCAATSHSYGETAIFALPEPNARASREHTLVAPRCNAESMTLAVHNSGRLTNVYGDDRELAGESAVEREVEIFQELIDTISARAEGADGAQILIYAHGGMVSHDAAVLDAERLAPYMLADGFTPLFLVWTSDPFTSYANRLCCVMDGYESRVWQAYFVPVRVVGDVVAGVARAPETYGKQVLRFGDSLLPGISQRRYSVRNDEFRSDRAHFARPGEACDDPAAEDSAYAWSGATVILPPYCSNRLLNDLGRAPGTRAIGYYANTPTRVVTTWLQGVGASAWDNMVRRTRMAFRPSSGFTAIAQEVHSGADCAAITRRGAEDAYLSDHADRESGAFERFFTRLSCELLVSPDLAKRISIHFYGHSMGAIVGDELMRRFPELPYRRIVYMAAADSVRDFSTGALPIVQVRGVEFYNLMLHPMAETRELHYGGVPPAGSLLEWIDEMFESPRSPDDRVMGKWNNIRAVYQHFAPAAMRAMTFRVFPLQEDMSEETVFPRECAQMDDPSDVRRRLRRCHPLEHGDFNRYSFWRDRYLRGHMMDDAIDSTD